MASAALVQLWESGDRLFRKRLAALLPMLVESLKPQGHPRLEPGVRGQILAMGSATVDRLTAPMHKASAVKNWRQPPYATGAVRRGAAVRTFKG